MFPQITIKHLFGLLFGAGFLLAFVAAEPLSVGFAAAFCFVSWLGILWLIGKSLKHLLQELATGIRNRSLRGLVSRYRWACLDAITVTLIIFTIVISHFVVENSVANGQNLIWTGWTLWAIAAISISIHLIRRNDWTGVRVDQKE